MQEHHKMVIGGATGMTLDAVFHMLHEVSGICSDLAGIGGFFLVVVGIIKWWKARKEK